MSGGADIPKRFALHFLLLAVPPLAALELGNQRLGCKDRSYKDREFHKFKFGGSFLFPNDRVHLSAGKFRSLNVFLASSGK